MPDSPPIPPTKRETEKALKAIGYTDRQARRFVEAAYIQVWDETALLLDALDEAKSQIVARMSRK